MLESPPRFRGVLHQWAFVASIPAGIALVVAAADAVARLGAAIYAASLALMYGSSALFHRFHWSETARGRMRRLDHSMIFVLIAGTYTPFSLVVLDPPWSTIVLGLVWGGAAIGIAIKLARIDALSVVGGAMYLALGWVALLALPWVLRRLTIFELGLMAAGGVFYTVGAALFWLRRPDPRPEVFGYHEVWHALVVAASACHYGLILSLVR